MSTEQERAAFEAPRVTGAPDEIWLCYGDIAHDDTHAECCRQGEVTWCEGKQGPADVKYVRAALAAAPVTCQTYGPSVKVPCAECNQTLVDSQELAELRERAAERERFPNLLPVIQWLERGCDPKEAAKELRIYQQMLAHNA